MRMGLVGLVVKGPMSYLYNKYLFNIVEHSFLPMLSANMNWSYKCVVSKAFQKALRDQKV